MSNKLIDIITKSEIKNKDQFIKFLSNLNNSELEFLYDNIKENRKFLVFFAENLKKKNKAFKSLNSELFMEILREEEKFIEHFQ